MIKTLRFSLVALLAMVANITFAQEVTLDFTDNSEWNFPKDNTVKGTDAKDFSNGTYTVTLEAQGGGYYYFASNKALLYGKKDATLTLPKFNFDVERIDVVGPEGASGKTTRNIFVGDKAVSTQTTSAKGTKNYVIADAYQAAGNVYTIKVTNDNNDQIQKVLVWKKGNVKPVEVPVAENITAFKALKNNTTAVLTLKDAIVLYKNEYTTKSGATNIEYYVRDASGSIMFYNTDLEIAEGDVLNGTIEGTYTVFNNMPEFVKSAKTSLAKVTKSNGTVTAKDVTVADLTDNTYLCDLVYVKGAIIAEKNGEHTNYYITADDEKVMMYDKFKKGVTIPTDGAEYFVKGIFVAGKIGGKVVYELAPLAITSTTGINNITVAPNAQNDVIYNVAGQRVGKDYKGLVIINGKKVIK